jgi:hypothetical protein
MLISEALSDEALGRIISPHPDKKTQTPAASSKILFVIFTPFCFFNLHHTTLQFAANNNLSVINPDFCNDREKTKRKNDTSPTETLGRKLIMNKRTLKNFGTAAILPKNLNVYQ